HADLVVKLVMVGLLVASVAVWAIAIEKLVLYSRTRRAMDSFEQAFWSGQSLEELYRTLASRQSHSMAALCVAARRSGKRRLEGQPRALADAEAPLLYRPAGAHEMVHECHHPARNRPPGSPSSGAGDGWFGRPLRWPVRARLGHHDELSGHRRPAVDLAGGGGPRHRRGPVRDRNRPHRRHTGAHFL